MTDNQATPEAQSAEAAPTPEADNATPAPDATATPENQSPEAVAEQEDLLFEEKAEDDQAGDDQGSDEDGDSEGEGKDENEKDGEAQTVDVAALEIPEDMPIPEELKGDLDQLMKDLVSPDLTPQQKAQKMIDAHIKSQRHSLDVWEATTKGWRDETLNDPTVGGKNWETSQKAANAAIRAIWANEENGGSKELLEQFQQDLKMLKLGNKLSFIKGMVNLSKMIGEDSQGDSGGAATGNQMDIAERLYGKDGQGRKA